MMGNCNPCSSSSRQDLKPRKLHWHHLHQQQHLHNHVSVMNWLQQSNNHAQSQQQPNSRASGTLTRRRIPLTKSDKKLPDGYVKMQTSAGQIFFVDPLGERSWYDPSVPRELLTASLDLDKLVGQLSSTWEIRRAPNGKFYYINHIKKTTQFTDPRLVAYRDYLMTLQKTSQRQQTQPPQSKPHQQQQQQLQPQPPKSHQHQLRQQPASRSSRPTSQNARPSQTLLSLTKSSITNIDNNLLSLKISLLRQELAKRKVVGQTCKINVRRSKIFEQSFKIISQMSSEDLKKRLNVKFKGEDGVDFGGVTREWFYLLSREMLNPNYGLFQYTSGDIYNLQINPDSGIVYEEHLSYMHFCGRLLGMAVFHGHFIEGHFTIPFYKMLLRKPVTLDDVEFVDPELHRSLCWMLNNDITDVLDTTFLVQHDAFGQLQEYELMENGKETAVTEKNKKEYVNLYVNYRCRRGIEQQWEELQRGFEELVEPSLLQKFNEHELELLIGGLSKIDVQDWKANTKLKNCTCQTEIVKWFWEIVKTHFNEDKRAQLLQFVTGSPRVPIQGFKALRGVESELRPFTIHLIRDGNTNDLPKTHTCFNRIDLPPYETFDKLRDKLTQAIEETMGFALQ